jgi:DNA-binding transcriptional LysR family regulator
MDVMLRLGPLEDSNLIARPLSRAIIVTAAAPSYLARRGAPRTPEDLAEHDCINFLDPLTGRIAEWDFMRGNEKFLITPERNISFNQGESRLAAAVMGLGVYRGMRVGIAHLLRTGSLRLILEEWNSSAPPLYVAYASHKNLPAKIRVFVDFMLACYPPGQDMPDTWPVAADSLQLAR